ncbi:MAG: hypothetical protein COA79_13145 [Planctomycetota bacterium]|nr:MAG: hypothetical protein COA79_13145 [Planctomycetota bacterium]
MKISMLKILLIDDDLSNLKIFKEFLLEEGHQIDSFSSPVEALNHFEKDKYDIVFSDLKMPEMDGTQVFQKVIAIDPNITFLLITAFASIQTAVELIKNGAYDYITKPIDLSYIQELLMNISNFREYKFSHFISINNNEKIIGTHKKIIHIKKIIKQIAPSNATVLITGESGTGKELIAREIHSKSQRQGEFIAINCGAIPKNLIESTLFGHEAGAFTGAEQKQIGKIEAANNGTLFLDEIGELPIDIQVKLLRTLSQKEYERVGGDETITHSCRILAATNRDLKEMVEEDTFRQDLLYRLNVIELETPPIRERLDDLPALFSFFQSQIITNTIWKFKGIDQSVIEKLERYPWPGNIRELRNCIESMIVMNKDGLLAENDMPTYLQAYFKEIDGVDQPTLTMMEMELKAIMFTLKTVGNNRRRAADILGISERTIYRKLGETQNE